MHPDCNTPEVWATCRSHGRRVPSYEVSTLGRIRRPLSSGRLLKPALATTGYQKVTLCDGGARLTCAVHQVVMASFVGDPPSGNVVNHKNGIKTDNRLENLEYTTPKENDAHARRIGLTDHRGSRSALAKLSETDVIEIIRLGSEGTLRKVIAQQFGIGSHYVSEILTGRVWAHVSRPSTPPRHAPHYRRVARTCQQCGAEFLVTLSDLKARPARFCNRKCSARARWSSQERG